MALLVSEPEPILTILSEMRSYYLKVYGQNPAPPEPVKVMDDRVEMVRKAHKEGRNMWLVDHDENFRMLGSTALRELGQDFDETAFAKLLIEKHRLYTDAPLRSWNELGIVIRMDSKLKRFKEVRYQKPQPTETAIDTLTDLLGYAVLGTLLTRDIKMGV